MTAVASGQRILMSLVRHVFRDIPSSPRFPVKRPAPLSQPELDRLKETSDSLREQVYRYINGAMAEGRLKPGDILNQESICEALKVSRAPLRDALIRLETEGLITIVPRRGVYINHTAGAFIRNACQILSALETNALDEIFHKLGPEHIRRMEESNARQKKFLDNKDLASCHREHNTFHDVFLCLCENSLLHGMIAPLRRRLQDFLRHRRTHDWETLQLDTHDLFIEAVRAGDKAAAIGVLRGELWDLAVRASN